MNKNKTGCIGSIFVALILMAIGAIITFFVGYGCNSYYLERASACYDEQEIIWGMYEASQIQISQYHHTCIDLEQERDGYKELFEDCNQKNDKRMGLLK